MVLIIYHVNVALSMLLPGWDDFRTFKWFEAIEDPGFLMKEMEELLAR